MLVGAVNAGTTQAPEGLGDGDADSEGERLGPADWLALMLLEPVCEEEADCDAETVADGVSEEEALGVGAMERDADALALVLLLGVPLALTDMLGVILLDGETDADTDSEGVTLPVADGEADAVPVGEAEDVGSLLPP